MTTAPNPSTAQARVVADELARSGVVHVVVCPGSRSAALAIALHEDHRLVVHVHPDERSAAFVALGIGRATGVPAAVVVTSGTAVANLLPATVEADRAAAPLLLLTADRPPELRGTGANQTIDQVGLLPPVRWVVELPVAEDRPDAVRTWRSIVARAVATARGDGGSLPGPVQIDVPMREPTVPAPDDGRSVAVPFVTPLDGRADGAPWLRMRGAEESDFDGRAALLAERLAGVQRGLILVGGPVGGVDASAAAVDAIAEATGWPVVAEVLAAARAGARALAAGPWLLGDEGFAAEHRPEVVLQIGRPTLHVGWGRWVAGASDAILIDPHAGIHDPTRSVSELLVADPTRMLTALAARMNAGGDPGWATAWSDADARVVDVLERATMSGPLTGLHVARAVLASVPAGVAVVAASSLPVRDLDLVAGRPRTPRVLANRGAAGIDGTVGTALGVALGTGRPVWGIVGDLAVLHDANGFLLQPAGASPPVTTMVVDNRGGRIFDGLPAAVHAPAFARLFTASPDRDLTLLGRLHGRNTVIIRNVDELALLGSAPPGAFMVAEVDPDQDLALRRWLRERVGAVLGGRG